MCRYGDRFYKQHYACFRCRKVFRHPYRRTEIRPLSEAEALPVVCPQCAIPMSAMGLDFKAPKNSARAQWRKAETLYREGYTFHSCGCNGPGPRPARLREVPEFLREQEAQTAEQEGQSAIAERTRQREAKRNVARKEQERKLHIRLLKKNLPSR